MAIFKILNESDLRRTEILWSLYTEEEKKSKIGMIVGAIKRIILAILKFIRDRWNKFAAKHRSNKLVTSADRLFKAIASKFVKTNNKVNNNNLNEKEVENMYNDVKMDSAKVQETAEKVVNTDNKEENNEVINNANNKIHRVKDLSRAKEINEKRRKAKEEQERQAREREEQERQAKEEQKRKAKEEQERQAREREEQERQAREREEQERQAKEEQKRKAKEEQERQAREREEQERRRKQVIDVDYVDSKNDKTKKGKKSNKKPEVILNTSKFGGYLGVKIKINGEIYLDKDYNFSNEREAQFATDDITSYVNANDNISNMDKIKIAYKISSAIVKESRKKINVKDIATFNSNECKILHRAIDDNKLTGTYTSIIKQALIRRENELKKKGEWS